MHRQQLTAKFWFWALLGAYVVVTLAQKTFPTQDGPVHLYYVEVARNLLFGDGSYSKYFTVQHWFPPYVFHTYLLMALAPLFNLLVAEKILVTLYTVWFCISFRYLVHAVNPADEILPLAAFPFVHNRTLFLGFYNFSFGVATALFVCGYWMRYYRKLTASRLAVLAFLFGLLSVMHPVALLLALMFTGTHVGLMAWNRYARAAGRGAGRIGSALKAVSRPALFVAAAGTVSAIWIHGFTKSGGLIWNFNPLRTAALLAMAPLTPFRPLPYRLLLAQPAAAVTILAFWRVLSKRSGGLLREESTPLVVGVMCVLIYIFGPFQVNYGAYFTDRFPIFAVAFIAAFAAGSAINRRLRARLGLGVAAISVICLTWQAIMKQDIIRNLAPVYETKAEEAGRHVAVISAEPLSNKSAPPNSFDPYMWAGLHYIRRTHGVLLNAAWMDTPISMFQPRTENRCTYYDPYPMAECLMGRLRKRPGTPPKPDEVVAVDRGVHDEDTILTGSLAMSLGLKPLAAPAGLLQFYGRRGTALSSDAR